MRNERREEMRWLRLSAFPGYSLSSLWENNMHIVQINNITVNQGGHVVFKDLSWVVGDRDRVGLIGPNGAGKSSLLRALAGEYKPDAGTIVRKRGVSVGYLPQTVTRTTRRTLIEEAMTLPPALAAVED